MDTNLKEKVKKFLSKLRKAFAVLANLQLWKDFMGSTLSSPASFLYEVMWLGVYLIAPTRSTCSMARRSGSPGTRTGFVGSTGSKPRMWSMRSYIRTLKRVKINGNRQPAVQEKIGLISRLPCNQGGSLGQKVEAKIFREFEPRI